MKTLLEQIDNLVNRTNPKDGRYRENILIGGVVKIVLKKDQRKDKSTQTLTQGKVKRILTKSRYHHQGIKVELEPIKGVNPPIGRVQEIQ